MVLVVPIVLADLKVPKGLQDPQIQQVLELLSVLVVLTVPMVLSRQLPQRLLSDLAAPKVLKGLLHQWPQKFPLDLLDRLDRMALLHQQLLSVQTDQTDQKY